MSLSGSGASGIAFGGASRLPQATNQDEVLLSTKTRSNGAQQLNDSTVSTASKFPAASAELTDRYRLFASFFEQLYLDRTFAKLAEKPG